MTRKYTWKHKDADVQAFINKIADVERTERKLDDGVEVIEQYIELFDSEQKAFEGFRSAINRGGGRFDDDNADEYVLVEVEIGYGDSNIEGGNIHSFCELEKTPESFGDCVNCSWGKMKRGKDCNFTCDVCGYTEMLY